MLLIGRDAELARLDALTGDLGPGRGGGALLLRGEAGIGKTALLDAACARAVERGARVLRARGIEAESELAFSALGDLLAPLHDRLEALPDAQAAALGGALALAPAPPGDRLAVCVATRALLSLAAADGPLLVAVDDAHWLDASSRECILYVARRASAGDGLAAVVTVREPADAVPGLGGLDELSLGPLARDSARRLLTREAPDLAPSVADAVLDATAGHPLALLELPRTLDGDQRRGARPLDAPLVPSGRLADAYAARVAALPEPSRQALLVAAAYEGDELRVIAGACEAAGTHARHLAAAEADGLVTLSEGRLSFVHPLVRGAIQHAVPAAELRAVHAALAGALEGERRAWHLAAATIEPDADVAAELEAAAGAAAARRGYGPASIALERSARLTADPGDFARRLMGAGMTAMAAGEPRRALPLLEESVEAAGDGPLRAPTSHALGLAMFWSGSVGPATALLAEEGERLGDAQPEAAAAMLADAAITCTAGGDVPRSLALAERASALLGDRGDAAARLHVLAALGWALILSGQTPRAEPLLAEAEQLAGAVDVLSPAGQTVALALNVRLHAGGYERARQEAEAICARARDEGALGALPYPLVIAADAAYRLGRWDEAEDEAAQAVAIGDEVGQTVPGGHAMTILLRVAAARGDEPTARAAAEGALARVIPSGALSGVTLTRGAIGFLELGLDRIDAAIAELEEVERLTTEQGMREPTLVPWAPDLIEAYVRARRTDDAARVLAVVAGQAAATATPWARAAHARCRGLVEDDFDDGFREALALDDAAPMPFERARTQLAYGRRLHRAKRRREAREELRAALREFERLGARPWATMAIDELRAAGGRVASAGEDELTPQERRVAAAVARGATNREIAAELYLAPKTVEFHLGRIYRKLDVRSRTQLVAALAEREGDHAMR